MRERLLQRINKERESYEIQIRTGICTDWVTYKEHVARIKCFDLFEEMVNKAADEDDLV
jgi:hypothetical protein